MSVRASIFLIIALVAAIFEFTGIVVMSANIARILNLICIGLFILAFCSAYFRAPATTPRAG